MINFIKRLFGVHVHEWGHWILEKEQWTSFGTWLVPLPDGVKFMRKVQMRKCKTCGFLEKEYLA